MYPNGEVCISILHPPGEDPNRYETSDERWSPVQSIEKILISVMSMLAEPNDESPANIEAAVRGAGPFPTKIPSRWRLMWIILFILQKQTTV